MPLKPLSAPPLVKLDTSQGVPILRLAPLDLNGIPADLPLVPVLVAHVVRCFERPEVSVDPSGPLTLTERGRCVLDAAATIYAKAAPGAPDEDRRRAKAFVCFRQEWATYLHGVLAREEGAPELIVCPIQTHNEGYRLVCREAHPALGNDYITLPYWG